MSFTEVAAVVGALAWIPPIVIGLRAWLTKPVVRVITQPVPEIGFTTYGPILNLRVALTVTHKDLVVTGIRLVVTHESGERTVFFWRGIVQRMGTMTYPQVGAVPFEKELNVLAMKVSQKDVEERFIRFQNRDFLNQKADLENISIRRMNHLKQVGTFDSAEFVKSQEMADLYAYIKQSFSWKPGGYRMKVELESPDAFQVVDDEYTFSLSPMHAEKLGRNLSLIETSYATEVDPSLPESSSETITWAWVYPDMQLVDSAR